MDFGEYKVFYRRKHRGNIFTQAKCKLVYYGCQVFLQQWERDHLSRLFELISMDIGRGKWLFFRKKKSLEFRISFKNLENRWKSTFKVFPFKKLLNVGFTSFQGPQISVFATTLLLCWKLDIKSFWEEFLLLFMVST